MFFFTLFVIGVAYVFARASGFEGPGALGYVGIALIFAGIANLGSYYFSDKLVLAISGAIPVDPKTNKDLYRLVENLTIAQGMPVPKIYVIEDSAPNAFATGRDPQHAAIAFTTGILQKLNKLELEGVAAHELSHVGNYDTRLMAIVAVLVGFIAVLADMFLRMQWFGNRRNDDDRGN